MRTKKNLEQEINEFLEKWDAVQMSSFLRDIGPLMDLYAITDENDWVKEAVGEDEARNVRLIRTVYLVSRIAEFHSGTLANLKIHFKDLYKKMEKQGTVMVDHV